MTPVLNTRDIGALVGLVNQERLDDAERHARALLSQHPRAGILWKILGVALMRQGKDALGALRKAAELSPNDAEAQGNLGAALHDRGEWAESLVSLHRALTLNPNAVDVLVDAADAERALGRVRESVLLYQRALALDGGLIEAHNNLGNALLDLDRCDDAVMAYRRALQIAPNSAQIHFNLGNAERQRGRLEEAMTSTRRAIALDPGLFAAHNNLGLVLAGLGQREAAVMSFRRALDLNPHYVEALNNLGTVLCDLGRRLEALSQHVRAIEIDPRRADSHCYQGNVLLELQRIDEAVASYSRALNLKPDYALAHLSLAAALRRQGRAAEAETSCQAALALEPNSVAALSVLGELRADQGRFIEAEEIFQRSIAIDPSFPFPYFSIATHRKMSAADSTWLAGTQALLEKPLTLRHEITLRYALGKYFDDVKVYDTAFGHYRQANELTKRYGVHYDRMKLTRRIDTIIGRFDVALLRRRGKESNASELPVFIVGMPRSGTTLTEQILASHPSVFGAGELIFWQTAFAAHEAATRTNQTMGPSSDTGLIARMAADYLDRLTAMSDRALRVVDKMPQNFMNLGLIHAAFPNAKIIHLRRHPIDTCLSIYFQYFSHLHPYANDLEDLAHFYGEYVRLMDHWRSVLPEGSLLEVPYEALIEDQEGWTRRMLDFIGLPWDDKCLDFHRTERVVTTLSKWQVRQKIHSASAGRWKNYQPFVGPLLRLADLSTRTLYHAPSDDAGPAHSAGARPVDG
jgi:tetratricopeptide (TPR) repeat protein